MNRYLSTRTLCNLAAAAVAATVGLGAAAAEARNFLDTDIVVDLRNQTFEAAVFLPDGSAIDLTSPRQVEDGAFALVDISVNLADDATASEVAKIIDEGFEPELGVCNSASIGAMAMEDSVRYSFRLGQGQEAVTATLFTGARSTHWANDFFCQYNEEIGPSGATMRVTGFFYVIHRQLAEGVDIQLRPVVPTDGEVEKFLKVKTERRASSSQ